MSKHDIIVIGASAGGVSTLQSLLSMLPKGLPASVFIVQHRPSELEAGNDVLPSILSLRSALWAEVPSDGQRIEPGQVYIAPRGAHLVVEQNFVRVETSPRESRARARPSIDVLFRSAAQAYGKRVVGVVLTGALDDGTAGLWYVGKHGGVTIVQDPAEALYPSMPESALSNVAVDYRLPLKGIARKLTELAHRHLTENKADRLIRVLIVEDERLVAMNLESRLRELGYDVVGSVASGQGALDTALLTSPDIALMDIKLDGAMDGTRAARLLWETKQIPSIFLTAYADTQVLEDAKLANPHGYIVKPFRPAQIHAAIQMAVNRHSREMESF